jgi:hypothetical protein
MTGGEGITLTAGLINLHDRGPLFLWRYSTWCEKHLCNVSGLKIIHFSNPVYTYNKTNRFEMTTHQTYIHRKLRAKYICEMPSYS